MKCMESIHIFFCIFGTPLLIVLLIVAVRMSENTTMFVSVVTSVLQYVVLLW